MKKEYERIMKIDEQQKRLQEEREKLEAKLNITKPLPTKQLSEKTLQEELNQSRQELIEGKGIPHKKAMETIKEPEEKQ